jgi:hypothetical protein
MTPYEQGQYAANIYLGFTKVAVPLVAGTSFLQRAGKFLSKHAPTWAGTKKMMIGEPGRFKDELVNRKLLSKGSLIREGFHAPGMFNKALFYGLPALDVVSAARSDSPDKAKDIAGILGGTVGSMAAFRPFGMVGAMAGSAAGSALGKGLLSKGRQVAGVQPPPEAPPTQAPGSPPFEEYVPYRQAHPYAAGASYLAGGGGG